VPEPVAPAAHRRTLVRVWLLGFGAFLLLAAAWAVITPYDGAYDEHDHVVRAAGVVRGQVLIRPSDAQNGRYQSVPRSLVPPGHECMRTGAPATCEGVPPDDRSRTRVMTRAGHYNPVYYAVVGVPLGPFPTMTGVVLARLVNAVLCAALLAGALVLVWTRRRHRFLVLAVLLSAAPMVLSLAGLVNPSGLEICAAVLLWAAATALARPDPDPQVAERALVVTAGVAATTLALVRPAGLVILGGILVAVWVAVGDRARLRDLLRRRDVRVAALVTAGVAALVVAWALLASVGSIGTEAAADERSFTAILRGIVLGRFDYWLRQTVGVFGYATIALPVWALVAWTVVQGLLVLLGFAVAPRRHAYTIAAIPAVFFLGGAAVEVATARLIGAFMQGRYLLPWWVGMSFLAALAVSVIPFPATAVRRIYGTFTVIYAATVAIGLYVTVRQFRLGTPGTPGTAGTAGAPWDPPGPTIVPYLILAAGVALVAWLVRLYLRSGALEPAQSTGMPAETAGVGSAAAPGR
jgi:hypothetical protein